MPLDNKGVNGSDYKRRGSIEHQAHEVIQPNLVNFIETGDKKYLKKLKQMQIKNTTNMVIGGGIKERINYDTDGKS